MRYDHLIDRLEQRLEITSDVDQNELYWLLNEAKEAIKELRCSVVIVNVKGNMDE